MQRIITERSDSAGHENVGGKARNLFHLMRNGIDVPPLFCLPTDVFDRFVEPYRARIQSLLRGPDASSAIQQLLANAEIDSESAQAITEEVRHRSGGSRERKLYSVRSSALSEDSADHSFAGMFATFLYVPEQEILDRIKQCWLSAYSENVLQYCVHNHLDPAETRVGVIIQEMIDSRCSGVMFTANPTGSIAETVIVAGYGVGEGVVSNKVETDLYVYHSETRARTSTINSKHQRLVFDRERQSGVRLEGVPSELRDSPVLTSAELDHLIAAGARITKLYEHYQDVEWCFDRKGQLYILQSRPITTIPRGKLTIFDNSNIVESFPGVTSPLSFSIILDMYREAFVRMFGRMVPRGYLRQHAEQFEHLVGYVEGRIYYDIINWYEMYKLLPLPGRFIVGAFDNLVGLYRGSNPQRFGGKQRKLTPLLMSAFAFNVSWRFLFLRTYLRFYKKRFDDFYAGAQREISACSNVHELLGCFRDIFDRYMSLASMALINDFFLMIFIGRTKALMGRLRFSECDDLFNALMCAEGVESAIPVQEAVSMAAMLRQDETLHEALKNASNREALEAVLENPRNAGFGARFKAYLALYGDRCPEELKLETMTFREDPLALVKTILAYVPLEITVEKIQRGEQAIRGEAEEKVARHLAYRPIQRAVLSYCLNRTRALIANRESARLDRGRAFGLMRSAIRLMGKRLHEDKAIADPADIFYLTMDELSGYVYGCGLQRRLREPVERSRKLLEHYRRSAPAERLHFSGAVGCNRVYQKPLPDIDGSSDHILQGISCSPGDLTAEAVVVDDPSAAPDVAGKIIVAQMTDPGWIFLMIVAAGLIVEKGSVLSHTAIIGREFGIPTIVGVKDATRKIRSGRSVTMRAGIGQVELC